jgi:hypothetical protein
LGRFFPEVDATGAGSTEGGSAPEAGLTVMGSTEEGWGGGEGAAIVAFDLPVFPLSLFFPSSFPSSFPPSFSPFFPFPFPFFSFFFGFFGFFVASIFDCSSSFSNSGAQELWADRGAGA